MKEHKFLSEEELLRLYDSALAEEPSNQVEDRVMHIVFSQEEPEKKPIKLFNPLKILVPLLLILLSGCFFVQVSRLLKHTLLLNMRYDKLTASPIQGFSHISTALLLILLIAIWIVILIVSTSKKNDKVVKC
jgi:hypothetical protein